MQFKEVIGQQEVKQRLLTSYKGGRLAHTQLFLGPEGSGALSLAVAFAQFVNCANPSETDSCGTCPSCKKFQKLAHPDLHFYFPTTTTNSVKKEPKSELMLNEWRTYLIKNKGYATQNSWYDFLGVGNKQGTIYVRDAADIVSKMTLKAYEAKYKIIIVWLVEKLHESASNKLLKTLEEPPDNTLILLVAERYELLLATVRSRAQLVKVPKLRDEQVHQWLINNETDSELADLIARQANGNLNTARELLDNADEAQSNFLLYRQWLRLCFKPGNFVDLHQFNQSMVKLGREKQKNFLKYALEAIHNSLTINNENAQWVKSAGDELTFAQNFAPYINPANQLQMYQKINEAIYHIERNAHAGILFSDLSFQLVDLMVAGRQYVKSQSGS
jgi:DNA polymerase-3 subunit delta'